MTSLGDIHVLLVDDNKQMRTLLRVMVRAGGVNRISEAETALEAFEIMRASPVDLVLVDWRMRPIDGLTFTRMIRNDHDSPNPYVPILMVTAHTEVSRVAAARDAGVTGFVKKPIASRLLFDRMSQALTDQRNFIRADNFTGPDRRHGQLAGYRGPYRRAGDKASIRLDTFDIE
ncbi:MAG: response regulator [Terricaulis sp.]